MHEQSEPEPDLVAAVRDALGKQGWDPEGPSLTVPRLNRADGEAQIVEIIMTRRPDQGFMITAVDVERGLRAQGQPSHDAGIAIHLVPWHELDR